MAAAWPSYSQPVSRHVLGPEALHYDARLLLVAARGLVLRLLGRSVASPTVVHVGLVAVGACLPPGLASIATGVGTFTWGSMAGMAGSLWSRVVLTRGSFRSEGLEQRAVRRGSPSRMGGRGRVGRKVGLLRVVQPLGYVHGSVIGVAMAQWRGGLGVRAGWRA